MKTAIHISTTDYNTAASQLSALVGDDLYGSALFEGKQISSVRYHPRYEDYMLQFWGCKGVVFLKDIIPSALATLHLYSQSRKG